MSSQWKKYLTTMQIVQFIIDLFAVYFGSTWQILRASTSHELTLCLIAYSYFAATYFDGIMPAVGSCAGTEAAALFGCGLLTSYLLLFINFYLQTYKGSSKGKKAVANGNGVANGRANGVAKYVYDFFGR